MKSPAKDCKGSSNHNPLLLNELGIQWGKHSSGPFSSPEELITIIIKQVNLF